MIKINENNTPTITQSPNIDFDKSQNWLNEVCSLVIKIFLAFLEMLRNLFSTASEESLETKQVEVLQTNNSEEHPTDTATKTDRIRKRINSEESISQIPEMEIEEVTEVTVVTKIDEIAEASKASEAYEIGSSWSMVSEIESEENKSLEIAIDQALAILDLWVKEKPDEQHRLNFKFLVTDFIRDVEKHSEELKELNASGLNLSTLPECLFILPIFKENLESLILDNNNLTHLPKEIAQLDALRGLSLYDNPSLNGKAAIHTLIQSKVDQNLDKTTFLENLENETFDQSISIETWVKIENEALRSSIVHQLATVDLIEDKFIKAFVDKLADGGEEVNPHTDDFQEFIEEQYLRRLKPMIRIPGDEEIDCEESNSVDFLELHFLRNFFDSYRSDKIIEHFFTLINESTEITGENKSVLLAWFEQTSNQEEDSIRTFWSNQVKDGKFTKKAVEYLLYKCNVLLQVPSIS